MAVQAAFTLDGKSFFNGQHFAVMSWWVGFALAMGIEHQTHGVLQSSRGHAPFSVLGVATTVTTVDVVVGIQERGSPGQVEIELEQANIRAVHLQDADADELLHQVNQFWGSRTNDLFVKSEAVRSPFSPEDDEDRFAGLEGELPSVGVISKPGYSRRGIGRCRLFRWFLGFFAAFGFFGGRALGLAASARRQLVGVTNRHAGGRVLTVLAAGA